jgi:hypothetical protein
MFHYLALDIFVEGAVGIQVVFGWSILFLTTAWFGVFTSMAKL